MINRDILLMALGDPPHIDRLIFLTLSFLRLTKGVFSWRKLALLVSRASPTSSVPLVDCFSPLHLHGR